MPPPKRFTSSIYLINTSPHPTAQQRFSDKYATSRLNKLLLGNLRHNRQRVVCPLYKTKLRNDALFIDQSAFSNPALYVIKRESDGPYSLLGCRGILNKLRTSYNVTVPCDVVMRILRELEPDAFVLRRARKLQRRSLGPNATKVLGIWMDTTS